MIITLFPAAAFSEPDEEITSFAPITLSAGTVSAAVYADAAAVIAALDAQYPSVTAATYGGGEVSVPVAAWTETDTYDPSTAGSYTFTATLGGIPAGYANPHNLTATAEVVVGGSGGALADGKYNIKVTALNEADEGASPVAALLSEDALLKVDEGQVTATLRFNRGTIDGADTYGSYVTGITTAAGATYTGTKLSSNTYDYTSTYKATVNDISAPTSATIIIAGVSKTFRLQFDCPSAFSLGPIDMSDVALRQAICALLGEDAGLYAIQKEDMEWLRGYLGLVNKGFTDLTGLRHAVNVTWLSLGNNNLGAKDLAAMLEEVAQLPNLEQLHLSNNALTSLPAIGGMQQLKLLNLSNNALTSLPAIGDMPSLAEINAGYNQLTDLPQFTNLPALTTFYGNNNNFQIVPESLFNLTSLVKLDLQNNAIAEIGNGISALANLENLIMNYNLLQTLPASFNGLSKLKSMVFANNQLTSLPADLSGLIGVTTVTLSYNMLENIPEGLFTLPNVEGIAADYNRVREVGGGIGNLNKLKRITLNSNQIEALPASMNNLTGLTQINMSFNNLTTLPDDLSGLTSLETAEFNSNNLVSLPDSVGNWTALKTLNLSTNSLKTLPASMGGLANLSDLNLGSNSFEALPGALASMPAVKVIKMSYNKVAAVSADLSGMAAVTTVQLQNNRLGELPEGFKTLPSVMNMQLQNNFLETIPENYFDGLTALKTLNITKNFIQFGEGSTALSEVQKLRSRSVTVTGDAAQGPFAALKSLESSVGELELKNDGALSYTLSAKAPAGTSSITLTPTGVKSDTTITMGDTTVNSGESLTAGGLAPGVNAIALTAASPIDGSQVTYQIQLIVGAGSSDGFPQDGHTYGITVTLLHASLDVPSMADNYIVNDAVIKIIDSQIYLYLTTDNADIMSDFRYRNAAGDYVAAELVSSDPAANLATYKMPVSTIDELLHLQAYSAPMGYAPYFRLSFDRDTLMDITGEQEPAGLADGAYTIPVSLWHATSDMASMGNGALEQTGTLVVEDGQGTLHLTFKALTVAAVGMTGYLSELDLLENIVFNQYNYPESYDLIPAAVISTYDVVDAFNAPDSTDPRCAGKAYPKEMTIPVVLEQEYTWVHVYVPIMGSMGVGDQVARIKLDYSGLTGIAEPGSETDKTALLAKLTEAKAIEQGSYTDGSYAALQTAIAAAQAVHDNADATQAQVNAQVTALATAIAALTVGDVDPGEITDGTYTIPVRLWHAMDDMASMGNGGLEQTAKLVVENGEGTLHLTFKALTVAAMDMTGYLSQLDLLKNIVFNQYNYPESYDLIPAAVISTYDVVDAFNAPDSTDPNCAGKMYPKEITVPVVLGQEYTWVHVYVPVMGSMGVGDQVARIKLDYGNLIAEGEPNPDDEPVQEITANAGAVTIARGDIAGISATRNIGLNFGDVNIVFPVQYLNNYFAGDASGTGSLQLQKNEAAAGTRQSIISVMAGSNTLVGAIELNLKIGEQPIADLGGSIKITISLTDEQVAALASAGSKKLCHYNPDTGALEDMGATFDLANKIVTFYTDHFSTYAIISTPAGGGNGGSTNPASGITDGNYSISVSALQQYSDSYSMAHQFIREPAGLEVSGGSITVTMVWYGTTSSPQASDGIHMTSIKKLQYKNSSGSWVDVTKTLNTANDTITIKFTVSSIAEPVYMRVQADEMGPEYKVFRLVFRTSTLQAGYFIPGAASTATATAHVIKATAGEGGSISPSGDVSVKKNENQTFTISANAGYKIKDVLVDGKSVGAVNTYTFKSVAKDGTISAVFEKTAEIAIELKFTDIAGHWAEKVIHFVVSRGMFTGTSETLFNPDALMTRGMFVTVLGRISQIDLARYPVSPFADVDPEAYYAPYIAWAAANDIVKGVGDGMFEPEREITREEMAAIFVKYAKIAGIDLPDASAPVTAAMAEGALKDGRYTIDASALMENKDDASMADQFLTEPATLAVAGGRITAAMVWHGTEYVTMDMLEELKIQKSGGELADVKRTLNQQANTLALTFEAEDLKEPVVMQVYVPRGMGEMRPKFRLVFDEATLTALKEQTLTFADEGEISAWAKESVEKIQLAGIIKGKENNMFDPQGLATRAEAAVILARSVGFSD